jgi:hypothetical protein
MPFTRIVTIFLSLSAVFAAIGMGFGSWRKLNSLSQSGVITTGEVVSTNCHSHGWFTYTYTINGKTYDGDGNDGASKACSDLVAGDEVSIVYLPSDPEQNASGDPAQFRDSVLFADVVISLFLSGFISVGIARRSIMTSEASRPPS